MLKVHVFKSIPFKNQLARNAVTCPETFSGRVNTHVFFLNHKTLGNWEVCECIFK